MFEIDELEEPFCQKISELTNTWLIWLKCNEEALDRSSPFEARSIYSKKCEELISRRNKLIKEIDAIFELKCNQKNQA
jgi:hypothetical protein